MKAILEKLGIEPVNSGAFGTSWIGRPTGGELVSVNPTTGEPIARVLQASKADYERVAQDAAKAFETWREWPAPRRGEVIRQIGDALRAKKSELGALVSLEMGKIRAEGEGEVQEMIDICDFAVGLSRQLYGLSMHSERPGHRMYEQWHPLGVVGIITAFNFPVAVWAWNGAIAAVSGDTMIWKPSSDTPLTAIAVQKIVEPVLERNGCKGIMGLVVGKGSEIGESVLHDPRIPLISATGSCQMGIRVTQALAPRYGRAILELGGNNGILVMDDADLDLTTRAVLFGAVGTAGQRCTSTRRLIMQKGIAPKLTERLINAYKQVSIGDPLAEGTLMGPLVNQRAVEDMMAAMAQIKAQGGEVLYGGKKLNRPGFFVEPTLVKARADMPIVAEETFAPILYLLECENLDEAIRIHNAVPQGLSSSIFTRDLLSAETFLSARGSDCGIANVNIGTSGAEIGGAFGGEKATGGGREAGSDSWKQYMRRQTCTINWSKSLPLAQGIKFGS
ncbi:MAG: aldehyde dehydrogenase family protein [Deltaproteobacteria bacterium]|nr:aldehyde dehydrogenase family protein [Deltaproteobacteria bacterium]